MAQQRTRNARVPVHPTIQLARPPPLSLPAPQRNRQHPHSPLTIRDARNTIFLRSLYGLHQWNPPGCSPNDAVLHLCTLLFVPLRHLAYLRWLLRPRHNGNCSPNRLSRYRMAHLCIHRIRRLLRILMPTIPIHHLPHDDDDCRVGRVDIAIYAMVQRAET